MFALLSLAAPLKKFTLLSGMFYVGNKRTFPTSMDPRSPQSNAPEDAAPSPDTEA